MRATGELLLLTVVISSLLTVDADDLDQAHNINAKYLSNVTIKCEDETFPNTYTVSYWLLPDMQILKMNESLWFKTLDGSAQWRVSENGSELQVILLYEEHFGLYYCHVEDAQGESYVMRRAINYYGPYFGDLWPEYMWPTIIGCSAAGTVLLLFMTICVVKELQWKQPSQRRSSLSVSTSTTTTNTTKSIEKTKSLFDAESIGNGKLGNEMSDDDYVKNFMAGSRSRQPSNATTNISSGLEHLTSNDKPDQIIGGDMDHSKFLDHNGAKANLQSKKSTLAEGQRTRQQSNASLHAVNQPDRGVGGGIDNPVFVNDDGTINSQPVKIESRRPSTGSSQKYSEQKTKL